MRFPARCRRDAEHYSVSGQSSHAVYASLSKPGNELTIWHAGKFRFCSL
jgi:hypothetical protein